MGSRRNVPLAYDERLRQGSGMMLQDSFPGARHPMDPVSLPARLENKLASQAEEIERLAGDNHKLATSHLALREELVAAQREVENIREHIRSIQSEGDIQIRILLDKVAKMEADIRAGNHKKKELEEVHLEAQSLVTSKRELTAKIQQATLELENARVDVKKIPEMHAELDTLKQEHQSLRKTFEHEKGINIEKVEQMKIMEKDLIAIAEEVERLRIAVINAEKRATAPIPFNNPYMNSDNSYQVLFHGNGVYGSNYGVPPPHLVSGVTTEPVNQHGGQFAVAPPLMNGPAVNGSAGTPMWEGTYDSFYTQR